jgi:staphylococcal nuclease domain-containing protein 1
MPFEARVKSVLSGDTVVLSHVTNPSQERILSLAYVSAPRLRREGDEVGASSLPIGSFGRHSTAS